MQYLISLRRSDHRFAREVVVEVIVARGCGLDVHQATVVACLLTGPPTKQIRSFRTLTAGLREMRDWLCENGCTHVTMESTGIYWQPVYAVLDGEFELVVGNQRLPISFCS